MTRPDRAGEPLELVGGWTVRWTDQLPDDVMGATRWRDRTIWLARAMAAHEVPHVLLHELMHALAGPGGDEDVVEPDMDRAADYALELMGLSAFADPWGSTSRAVA